MSTSVLNEVFGGANGFRQLLAKALARHRSATGLSVAELNRRCDLDGEENPSWERLEEHAELITARLFGLIARRSGFMLTDYIDREFILAQRDAVARDRVANCGHIAAKIGPGNEPLLYDELSDSDRDDFDVFYALMAALEDLDMIDTGGDGHTVAEGESSLPRG